MTRAGLVSLILLAGCTTAPDGSTLGPQESAEHQKCISQFGHQFGTPAYGECRILLAQIRTEENAALQASLRSLQESLEPPPPPPRLSTAQDHHVLDKALHQNILVAERRRHRVVVAAVADQSGRRDPGGPERARR